MNFLNGSFVIGRWFDVTVRVHILFVLFALFQIFGAGSESWQPRLAFITMLFGIVLLHEFGHCFGARAVGGRAHDILMWPLGGLAYADAPMTPWAQFVTIAAGPAVNVLLCLLSGSVLFATTHEFDWRVLRPLSYTWWPGITSDWQFYLAIFFGVNWMLLCFNLLPVFPLDGGQLFRVFLWRLMGFRRGTMLARQVGVVGGVLLAIWGFMGRESYLLVFIGIWGASTAWQMYQAAKHGAVEEDFGYAARVRRPRKGGWWGTRSSTPRPTANPNPGGWERRQSAEAAQEAEIDRILGKVREHGAGSLSYIERQLLERRSRKLREEEQERLGN